MKQKSPSYLLLALLVLFMASCSKKVNVPVPADASVVVHISGSSLASKLSWEEFKKSELYQVMSEDIHDSLQKRILDNPETSGIDIKSDAFFFVRNHGRGGYAGFTCTLKDEKAFTAFVKKTSHEEITKEGNFSVIKNHSSVLTWNSSRLVVVGDTPGMNGLNSGFPSTGNRRFDEDSLFKFATEVYDIKGDAGIGSNERFASLMKEPGDMHFWFNPGNLYKGYAGAMINLTKASLLFEGNYTASTLNFDNGKITIDNKSYYNKELEALYKKYSMKNFDEDMLKKIPSNNVVAVFAMKYPPEGLKEFMALLGVDGIANEFLSSVGYSIDDFVKANKGDLLLAVSDFTSTAEKPDGKILFATSVKDKASFQKLVTIITEKINEQGSSVAEMAGKIPYSLKDDWFVAGNDATMVNSFGTATNNQPFISKISGHPMGVFIDIQKVIAGIKPSLGSDSTAMAIADESTKFWQDVVFYGGEINNGAGESHMEINLVDKSTNSLKQLNTYLGTIAKNASEREKRQRAMWESESMNGAADSTMAIPAPPIMK